MEPVRWGILSTARINLLLLEGARQTDAVEVLAVASRDRARAEAYAREHGIARAHGSYEDLLADPDVEAVYVPLPNSLHVEWSVRALEAGKHVLCEKPLTRRPEEAERAFDVAEREGRFLMEAFMYRHNPHTLMSTELVRQGVIGRLKLVKSVFSFATPPGDVRLEAGLDGGALMDVGCYCVSHSRLLAGEPERVYGEQVPNESGVDLRFSGVMRFPGDVLAHFDCALDAPRRHEVEIVGEEGTLELPDPWVNRHPSIRLRRGDEIEQVEVERVDAYMLELENLSRAIRGEAEPLLGRADALAQARALDGLYRSAEEGRPIAP